MNLEHLNTTQIVLLTLLVSFVTSIATGIVTVTLLDQAPPGVTHTISKVVEHTVEKVVPAKNQGASVVKTVIIKEDDLISKAVEKNKRSLVEIFVEGKTSTGKNGKEVTTENQFIGTGFIASRDGLVITDSALVSEKGEYKVKIYNGDELSVEVVKQDEEKGIAILKIVSKNSDGQVEGQSQAFSSVIFADSNNIKLGQTIVLLGGVENTVVLTGIVSSFSMEKYTKEIITEGSEDVTTEEIKYRSAINTNISISAINSGSISLNTDGGTIGMNIARSGTSYAVPSNLIVDMITKIEKAKSASVNETPTS